MRERPLHRLVEAPSLRPTAAVHQIVPALSAGDAVGNLVRAWRRALVAAGHPSQVFAGLSDAASASEVLPVSALQEHCDADTVLIVHHSFQSRQVPTIRLAPGRKLLAYHNVTPARFFEGVDSKMAEACAAAREELRELAGICEGAVAFSRFSAEECVAAGMERVDVIPFTVSFERFRTPADPELAAVLGDGARNVLFVGRVVPNKRVDDVLRVFTAYQRLFQPDSRLVIAGELNRFSPSVAELESLRGFLGPDRVLFLGKASEAQLAACFAHAHAYLSMSQHEGFGVPLLEAMERGVPVVAYGAAAVPETMGGAGITVRTDDPIEIARLLRVLEEEDLRAKVLAGQRARLERHQAADPTGALIRTIEEGPRPEPGLPRPIPERAIRIVARAGAQRADGLLRALDSVGEEKAVLTLRGEDAGEGRQVRRYSPDLPRGVRSSALEMAATSGTGPVILLEPEDDPSGAIAARVPARILPGARFERGDDLVNAIRTQLRRRG